MFDIQKLYTKGDKKMIVGIIVAAVVLVFFITGIKIVPQAAEYIVERLGKYKKLGVRDFTMQFLLLK